MSKTGFSKTKCFGFFFCIFFLWFVYGRAFLYGCKAHTKVFVWIFFSAIRTQNEIVKIRPQFHKFRVCTKLDLGLHKISEKFSRNSFFMKFHPRISTEFGTKHDKFQVKQMSIHPRKKSKSFTQTNLPFSPGSDE